MTVSHRALLAGRWRCYAASLLLGVGACRGDAGAPLECPADPRDYQSVQDSSGIVVVHNRCPQLDFGWEVSEAPILQIGGPTAEGAAQFRVTLLTWATRLSDGRIVILDRAAEEIRYFSASGEHLATSGRRGDGPGEFRMIFHPLFLLPDDSLVAFDLELRRATVFDPEGQFAAVARFEGPEVAASLIPFGQTPDGSILARTGVSPSSLHREDGVRPWVWTVLRIPPDLGPPRPVMEVLGQLEFTTYPFGPFVASVPFSLDPYVGSWGNEIVVGDRLEYVFRVYDLAGTPTRVVSRRFVPRPVTTRELEDRRDTFLRQMRRLYQDEFIPAVARMYEGPDVPRTHPAFDPVLVDRVGNLWVGANQAEEGANHTWRPPGRSTLWSVFDPEGIWITDARIPGDFWITDIGDDYVLGVWEDELGVPYIREYALMKN